VMMVAVTGWASDPDDQLKTAVETYNTGDLKKAHALLAEYLCDRPNDVLALEYQGIVEL